MPADAQPGTRSDTRSGTQPGARARSGARPRAGLSPAAVVTAALAVVDEGGEEALTLARVAARTGVAVPSLYKHVDGLPALRRLLRLRVLAEFDQTLRAATIGRSEDAALRALATAYRDYLRRYPHRQWFLEVSAESADPELLAAGRRVVEVVFAALRGYGLTGSAAVHATRCLRAAVHGFTRLEAIGGFGLPEGVDDTFELLLQMITRQVAALAATGSSSDDEAPPT